jgi:hypothetical protein
MIVPPLTAAQAFAGYLKLVIPTNAPPDQIEECRRAFMSGIAFLLGQLENYIAAPEVSEDVGHEYLSAMHREVDRFLRELKEHSGRSAREALGQMQYTTPDPDHIASQMRDIGERIGEGLPPGYGFLLMIFNFGEGGNMFYISNGEREDMMNAMREFLQKQTQ